MTRNRRRPVGGHTSSDAVLAPPIAPTGPAPGATRLSDRDKAMLYDVKPGTMPIVIGGGIMAIPGEDYSETCARQYGVTVAEPPPASWDDNDWWTRCAYAPPPPGGCQREHPGWVCTGEKGHAGPCPLWPIDPADLPPGGAADYVRAVADHAQLRDDTPAGLTVTEGNTAPVAIVGEIVTVPVNIGHRWTEPVGRISLHDSIVDRLCADDTRPPRLNAGFIREHDGTCRLTDVALIFDDPEPATPAPEKVEADRHNLLRFAAALVIDSVRRHDLTAAWGNNLTTLNARVAARVVLRDLGYDVSDRVQMLDLVAGPVGPIPLPEPKQTRADDLARIENSVGDVLHAIPADPPPYLGRHRAGPPGDVDDPSPGRLIGYANPRRHRKVTT